MMVLIKFNVKKNREYVCQNNVIMIKKSRNCNICINFDLIWMKIIFFVTVEMIDLMGYGQKSEVGEKSEKNITVFRI